MNLPRTRTGSLVAAFVAALLIACGAVAATRSMQPVDSVVRLAPTPVQQRTLLHRLKRIDAGLVQNRQQALSQSASTCRDMRAGVAHDILVRTAAAEYEGDLVHMTHAKSERVVATIRAVYCTS